MRGTEPERFFAKVRPDIGDACWLWSAAKMGRGYGKFKTRGRYVGAHRWSWEYHYGPVPDGMDVCHRCDVPACVRPDHLFVGSRKNNIMDASSKGRLRFNERNHNCRLGKGDVQAIRARAAGGESLVSIAAAVGVSSQHISNIVLRKRRASVQDAAFEDGVTTNGS